MKKSLFLMPLVLLTLVGCGTKPYTCEDGLVTVNNIEKTLDANIELEGATLSISKNDEGKYTVKVQADESHDIDQIIVNGNKYKYDVLEYKNVLNEETSKYCKTYSYELLNNEISTNLTLSAKITPIKNKSYLSKNADLKAKINGKQYSIMGDSISTFEGYNNNADYNSNNIGNAVYYPYNNYTTVVKGQVTDMHDTYWGKTIDDLGLTLCVNNSYSGSHVQHFYSNAQSGCMERSQNLHNDHTSTMPDIITIYLGINDFGELCNNRQTRSIGTFTSRNDIVDADGNYLQSAETTFATAYALMLDKMTKAYPNARIYCSNLLSQYWNYDETSLLDLAKMNEIIKSVSQYYKTAFVDMWEDVAWDVSTGRQYYEDNYIHPNVKGMNLMAKAFENAIIRDFDYQE